MNIAVCICEVPDPVLPVTVTDGTPDLSRVSRIMNPYDEYAVEEAVRLKERFPGSPVTAFTVTSSGGGREALLKALAMGADRAVEVLSASLADSFQIASMLSAAIRTTFPDALPQLVCCGRESSDYRSAAVPAMLAGMLGMAYAGAVTAFRASDGVLELERETEGGVECLEACYPLVFSAEKGLNTPRKTGIRQVMEARRKPLETLHVAPPPGPLVRFCSAELVSRKRVCRFAASPEELAGLLLRAVQGDAGEGG